jgi:hypothetical protein
MAFPNVTDIVATTIESRSKKVADNVTKNNAVLTYIQEKGGVRTFSGGSVILEPLAFAENSNFAWYSGYDLLPVQAADVITAAQFPIKQAAVSIIVSGLEQLQNSGDAARLDLLEQRIKVGENTLKNNMSAAIYSDGTGYGGKQVTGLLSLVSSSPTSGTVGGIDRAVWPFFRNAASTGVALTTANLMQYMNTLWGSLVRGADHPNLIVLDPFLWGLYLGVQQPLQRFLKAERADTGFPTMTYMTADVVLDGGIGGFCPPKTGYFLNTDYLFFRPHADRNFVPITPNKRYSINQDAEVVIEGWAGNLTISDAMLQGVLVST